MSIRSNYNIKFKFRFWVRVTLFSQFNTPSVYFRIGFLDQAFIWSRRLIGARSFINEVQFSVIFSDVFITTILQDLGQFAND